MKSAIGINFLVGSLLTISTAVAQQSDLDSNKDGQSIVAPEKESDWKEPGEANPDARAKDAFIRMQKLIKAGKLKEASEFMTKKGQDEFSIVELVSSFGMVRMEMSMPVPQLEDVVDEIENVLIKYELDDLDVDLSDMFRIEMSVDGDLDEDTADGEDDRSKNRSEKLKKAGQSILEAVDKTGKRWQLLRELMKAKHGSPFSHSPLTGRINKIEMSEESAFLEIVAAPANENGDGIVVQVVMPPTIVRMSKNDDGTWLFDGRDEKRTDQAVKKFMKEHQERFGGDDSRTDF